jgi:chemotaxis regulatin CheY-phosphate phosphatase CheZ
MKPNHVTQLAGELESKLNLLNELVTELGTSEWGERGRIREILATLNRQPSLADLPRVLLRCYAEIAEALGGIRLTREAIQAHAVERLRDTHLKLNEVSFTTESATLEMMNALDRAQALIDDLEVQAGPGPGKPPATFDALRAEVNQMFNCLQFQDITAQQLQGVNALLVDVEARIESVAGLFDHAFGLNDAGAKVAAELVMPDETAYNPDASVKNTAARQAMIDAAFTGVRKGNGTP